MLYLGRLCLPRSPLVRINLLTLMKIGYFVKKKKKRIGEYCRHFADLICPVDEFNIEFMQFSIHSKSLLKKHKFTAVE